MALQSMRKNMKYLKWVLWLVIAAFVALFGTDWSGLNSSASPRVAATVGKAEVLTDDVASQYRFLESRYRQILGDRFTGDEAQRAGLMGQALQQAVRDKIMLLEARELGLVVTDDEVREEILSYPLFQDESGRFIGAEEYRQRLRRGLRTTSEAFERSLRESLELRKLDAILRQTIYVSEPELEEAYREQAEKAKIRYLQVPATRFADLEITPEDLAAHFGANSERYAFPERRVVDYILVDPLKLRGEMEIPEPELRAYYDDHQDEFTSEEQVLARHILLRLTPERDAEAARRELAALREKIEQGEDFAALAQQHSEEVESAQRGGSLGLFGRDAYAADFTETVFGAEPGSLIGPVETQYGMHLIEVQNRRPGGLRPFEQVRAQIQNRLLSSRANELAESRARDLAQTVENDVPATAEAFAATGEAAGFEVKTTEPFGATDAVPGIGRGVFPQTAFELGEGEISELVKVPRGWALLRLREVQPPRLPELAEVENRIRPVVLLEKRQEAAKTELEAARARLAAGEITLDELATELEVEPQESAEFGAGGFIPGIGQSPEAVTAALEAEVGDVAGPFTTATGAMLFEVVERKSFDPAEFEQQKSALRESEEQQRLNELQQAIIERRIRELDVQYNPEALTAFGLDRGMLDLG